MTHPIVERVARVQCGPSCRCPMQDGWCPGAVSEARAAVLEALTAMEEPSEGMVAAVCSNRQASEIAAASADSDVSLVGIMRVAVSDAASWQWRAMVAQLKQEIENG